MDMQTHQVQVSEYIVNGAGGCAPPQIAVASGIIKQDGVGALYRGLSAGLLRQATYTTARLGIYQIFTDSLTKHNEGGVRDCAPAVPRLSCGVFCCSGGSAGSAHSEGKCRCRRRSTALLAQLHLRTVALVPTDAVLPRRAAVAVSSRCGAKLQSIFS